MAKRRDERSVSVGGQISIGSAISATRAAGDANVRRIEGMIQGAAEGLNKFLEVSERSRLTAGHARAFDAASTRFSTLKEEARLTAAEQGNYGDYPTLVKAAGKQTLDETLRAIQDPKLKKAFSDSWNSYLQDQQLNSYGEARTYQLEHSKRELDHSLKSMAASATGRDPVQNQALLKEVDASLEGAVKSGLMAPKEADNAKQAVSNSIVQKMVEENPRAAKMYLESPEAKKTLGDIRTSQLNARAEQKIKQLKIQQDAASKEQSRQIKLQVSRAEDSIDKGLPLDPSIVDSLNISATNTNDKSVLKEIRRLEVKNRITQDFVRLTPLEQENAIRILGDSDLELSNHLKKVHDNVKAGIKKDPYAQAIAMGIMDNPEALDFDGDIGPQLSARLANTAIAERRLGTKMMPMTNQELDALQEKFEASSYQDRAALAGDLVSGLGSKSTDVFKELNKRGSGTLAFAGLLATEGNLDLATQVFRGQDLRKTNKDMIPQFTADAREVEEDILGEYAIAGQRSATITAAQNIYLSLSAQENDYSGEFNEDRYEKALQMASNGGKIEYNDSEIEAPVRGMDDDDFQDWIDGISVEDINRLGGIHALGTDQYTSILKKSNLKNIGRGQYMVVVPTLVAGDVMEKPLLRNDGELFILDYHKLNSNEANVDTEVDEAPNKLAEEFVSTEVKKKNELTEKRATKSQVNNLMADAMTGGDERVAKEIDKSNKAIDANKSIGANILKHSSKADHKTISVFDTRSDILNEHGIKGKQRLSMFLAQVAHESNGFRNMEEMLSDDEAEVKYSYITKVGRMLGNTQPGDGAKYKGRGFIQLTGRWNYEHYGKLIGVDLINNPEKAAEPETALKIAAVFWQRKGLNKLADKGDFKAITKKINGGYNGHDNRKMWLQRFKGESN